MVSKRVGRLSLGLSVGLLVEGDDLALSKELETRLDEGVPLEVGWRAVWFSEKDVLEKQGEFPKRE